MFRRFFQILLLFVVASASTAELCAQGRYQDQEIPTESNVVTARKPSGKAAFDLLVSDTEAGAAKRAEVTATRDARSATQIGWHHFDKESWATANTWFSRAIDWAPNSSSAAEGLILTQFKSGNESRAYELATTYANLVPKARPLVIGAVETRAWKQLNAGNLDAAEKEIAGFPASEPGIAKIRSEIGSQRVNAAAKEKDYAKAREVAQTYGTDVTGVNRSLSGDLVTKAAAAQKSGRYTESQRLLNMAENTQPLDAGGQQIRAWNYYHTRNFSDAATIFENLYRANPEKETAEGLTYSLQQRGRISELRKLSGQLGGPLATTAAPVLKAADAREKDRQRAERDRQTAYAASQRTPPPAPQPYAAAPSYAPPAPQPTAPSEMRYGPPAPAFQKSEATGPEPADFHRAVPLTSRSTAGVAFSQQSGDDGLSALQTTELPASEITAVFGPSREQSLTLSISRKDLDVGEFSGNRPVGSPPRDGSGSLDPDDVITQVNTVEPMLTYRNENRNGTLFSGEVGTTPLGGEVDASLIGGVSIDQRNEMNEWHLGLFSESVQESILSATGLRDPYSGNQWGRVKRSGVRGSAYSSINGGPWGAFGSFEFAGITGENVADNSALALTAGLSRNFDLPGFEYFAVGPSLTYEAYDKNLSHFTYGHGGYFSPESMIQGLVGGTFLTETGGRFLAGGFVGLGYQTNDQAAAAFLPLSPDGREFDASSDSSVVFTAHLQSVYELSPQWHMGVSGGYSKTAAYEEYGAAFFLRYLWNPQYGLTEADLPLK